MKNYKKRCAWEGRQELFYYILMMCIILCLPLSITFTLQQSFGLGLLPFEGESEFPAIPQSVCYYLTDYFRWCIYCHCSARPAVSHVGSSHPLLTSLLSSICVCPHANMCTDVHFWRGFEDSFIVALEWAVSSAFHVFSPSLFQPPLPFRLFLACTFCPLFPHG